LIYRAYFRKIKNFLHVFRDPDDEFRDSNNDRVKIKEKPVQKVIPNEWSSPEIEIKDKSDDKKHSKRNRSGSTDSEEHRKRKKKKKHKKKENKKRKSEIN
jgi:hypothetical protein